jgi:hypothetical protein
MALLGNVGHGESCFGLFRVGVVSVQDRCTICTKTTIGLQIVLDEADGTPR